MTQEEPQVRTPDRLDRRRRLLLWSALPVLLALLLAAKLFSVALFSAQSITAYEQRDAAAVANAANGLAVANFLETHKPAFADGDALVLAGDFAGARLQFEESLAAAPGADECRIRVNLTLSIERLGDAAVEAGEAAAATLFQEGLNVAQDAPDGCFAVGADAVPGFNDAGEGDQLAAARGRLQEKTDAAAAQASDGAQEDPNAEELEPEVPVESGQQSRLERIDEMAGRALRDRTESEDRQKYLDSDGPSVDKPW